MLGKPRADQTNVTYDELDPVTTWEREATFDTLIVHLPGFRKEQLKVQVTSSNKLRISGERPLDSNKWIRFRKYLPIPENCDSNEISAKFEGGKLYIKHPKIVTPADNQPESEPKPKPKPEAKGQTEAPKPESDYAEAQKKGQEQAAQEVNPPSTGQEQASQEADPPKTTSLGKQPSKNASGVGSASADIAKTASRKSSEKKSTEDMAEEGKSTSGTVEKDENLDAAAAKAERETAGNSNGRRDKFRIEELKQAFGGLLTEMKQQRKLRNIIVAGLLVLVTWIYARYAIGSIGKSNN